MTANSAFGMANQGGGGATSDNFLLGTTSSGGVLARVDVRAYLNDETVSGTPVAGAFTTRNIMTGVQWVTHGGTPVSITTSPVTTGNWLLFGEGIEPLEEIYIGQSATTYVTGEQLAVKERWRGILDPGGQIDVYWSYGENTSLSNTVAYKASLHWSIWWATFP